VKDRASAKKSGARRCVQLGVAKPSGKRDGRLVYDWSEIRRLFADHWPNDNLFAFCTHYDVNYPHARANMKNALRAKREAMSRQARGHWDTVRDMAAIEHYEEVKEQSARFRRLLGSLEHAAAGCVKYVELHCVKVTEDGVLIANTQATMKQMSSLSLIAFRAASTMKLVIEMGRGMADRDEGDTIAEPTPAPPPLKLTGT